MATGLQHNKVTIRATWVVAIISTVIWSLTGYFSIFLGTTIGCFSGMLITPDLDQENVTRSQWILVKKTGGLGWLWVWIWWPYAVLVPHRHFISHFPVISSVIRFSYLRIVRYLWVGSLIFVSEEFHNFVQGLFSQIPWQYHLSFLVGLIISDTLHWFMDMKPMWLKNRIKKREIKFQRKYDSHTWERVND